MTMADNYTVTSQRQTTVLMPNRRLQQVIEVEFDIPKAGVSRHVDIPVDQFTPETVKAAIEKVVEATLQVHNL